MMSSFHSQLYVAVLFAVTCCAGAVGAEARISRVEFLVSDTYGEPLKAFELRIVPEPSAGSRAVVLRKSGEVSLAPGVYRVTGSASLHQPVERMIFVEYPSLFVNIALPFRDPGNSDVLYPVLRGRVVALPSDSVVTWVRLLSMFGTFAKEARVESDGAFRMQDVPYGDYFIVAMRGNKVAVTRQFRRTVREEEAVIDLRP
jgi:hypothetical protein